MSGPPYAKSTCVVPGCASWSRRYPGEWICGRHFRLVRPSLRRAVRKSWRLLSERITERQLKREARLWAHVVRQATLRAAGL